MQERKPVDITHSEAIFWRFWGVFLSAFLLVFVSFSWVFYYIYRFQDSNWLCAAGHINISMKPVTELKQLRWSQQISGIVQYIAYIAHWGFGFASVFKVVSLENYKMFWWFVLFDWHPSLLERPLTVYQLLSSSHVIKWEVTFWPGCTFSFHSFCRQKRAAYTDQDFWHFNWPVFFRQSCLTIAGTFTRCTLLGQSVDQYASSLVFASMTSPKQESESHHSHPVNYCTVHRIGTLSWYVLPTFLKGWVTVLFPPILVLRSFGDTQSSHLWSHSMLKSQPRLKNAKLPSWRYAKIMWPASPPEKQGWTVDRPPITGFQSCAGMRLKQLKPRHTSRLAKD